MDLLTYLILTSAVPGNNSPKLYLLKKHRLTLLLDQIPSSIEKVAEVDTHIGAAMSGLTPDARTLIEHARVETQVDNLFIRRVSLHLLFVSKFLVPKLIEQNHHILLQHNWIWTV